MVFLALLMWYMWVFIYHEDDDELPSLRSNSLKEGKDNGGPSTPIMASKNTKLIHLVAITLQDVRDSIPLMSIEGNES